MTLGSVGFLLKRLGMAYSSLEFDSAQGGSDEENRLAIIVPVSCRMR
ncbi:MAG: hypothetical protein EWM72_02812 [Nitrospira sp.]|nr:MAG: hypothetical protein EWM72_02812 [Nitrospira sp.]